MKGLPDLDPEKQLVYTTVELIEALRISKDTFYRHKGKLGLIPRKKRNSNAKWWTHDQAMQLFSSIYQPLDIIRLAAGQRRRR